MKCHAGVEFQSGKPCPKCGAKLGEVCWPGINADLLEVVSLRDRLKRADAAWVLLNRWENIAKNGGEKWLRDHPLVDETTKLLNEEAALTSAYRKDE